MIHCRSEHDALIFSFSLYTRMDKVTNHVHIMTWPCHALSRGDLSGCKGKVTNVHKDRDCIPFFQIDRGHAGAGYTGRPIRAPRFNVQH